MKIMHYFLGFPPERTGGLTSYVMSVAKEQQKNGDRVYMLYPGAINLLQKKTYIKSSYKNNFKTFEIINSLPLAISGGIKNPTPFMKEVNDKIYDDFLKSTKPDVIHVHTLMGIHKQFFEAAKKNMIKIIFTTHDYYGLAPEPTFFYNGKNYDTNNTINQWMKISETAMNTWKLRIFQFKNYVFLRKMLKKIKKVKKNEDLPKSNNFQYKHSIDEKLQFEKLRQYYMDIFSIIDVFHFNSNLAKEIYLDNLDFNVDYKVISITNENIKKNQIYAKENQTLKIGYIGPYKEYKGFFEYLKLVDSLNIDAEYHIFGSDDPINVSNKIINHGRYKGSEINNVFKILDILIVPSLWKETFGFTTLEALSFGVKVLVSERVGSKDLVDQKFIFSKIEDVNNCLQEINNFEFKDIKTIHEHYNELINSVYK